MRGGLVSGPPSSREALPTRGGLTADLCARAVIAAARAYGDDPDAAMTAKSGKLRRCLAPAASALQRAGVCSLSAGARMLQLGSSTLSTARSTANNKFDQAEAAAIAAVKLALARLEPVEPRAEPVGAEIRREAPARTLSAAKVRREVIACLEEDPSSGPELMQLVGVGEGQIRAALLDLSDAGLVVGTPLTAEGWTARTWRLSGTLSGRPA